MAANRPRRDKEGQTAPKVLVIDDEPAIVDVAELSLREEGYEVIGVCQAQAGLQRLATERPDVVVLDLRMPGMDGLEACQLIRASSDVPILIMTAVGDRRIIDLALALGADEYLPKPFDIDRLALTVHRLLYYSSGGLCQPDLRVGDLQLAPASNSLTKAGRSVRLGTREFQLLYELVINDGRVVNRGDLLRRLWGRADPCNERLLGQCVTRLQRKLAAQLDRAGRIHNISSMGLCFLAGGQL